MRSKPFSFQRTLAMSVAAGCAASASSAILAQDAGNVEQIVVTGSRIRQTPGMVTPTPVTAVTTDELSSFEPGGTVAEQLDALPQFFSNETAQRGGGALFGTGGGSYLDMRDLGRQRTLVLLDGSRVVPSDKRGAVNVDVFPTALVRRVDVVTGGASATYGADALGGVTNFVLDREFQGLKIQSGMGQTDWGDGQRWNFSIAGGTEIGDKVNLIASLEARHIDQIDRDPEELGSWFQRWGWVTNPDWQSGAPAGVPQRLTLPWVTSSQHSPYGLIRNTGVPELDYMKFTPDGSDIEPFVLGDVVTLGGPGSTRSMAGGPEAVIHNKAFGGGPSGQEVVGRSGFLGLQYRFSDDMTGFVQYMSGTSESNEKNVRGSYSLQDLWYTTIPIDNAYLPQNVRQIMMDNGLDSIQVHKLGSFLGVPEIGYNEHDLNSFDTDSWSIGFDWSMPNGWDMRASWQSGNSHKHSGVEPKIRVDRMFLGMDAVEVYSDHRDVDGDGVIDLVAEADRGTGEIICRVQAYNPTPEELAASPAVQGRVSSRSSIEARLGGTGDPLLSPIGLDNTVQDCVPYNVLGNGNESEAALQYVTTPKIGLADVDQDFAEILVNGEISQGWGYGPLSLAAGLTYRKQSFSEGAIPVDVDALGPPLNDPNLGIRGIPPGYTGGSPNLHQFSTVPLISGEYDVWEWFGELNLPLWKSSSGTRALDGSVAYRSSDYSTTGQVDAWKLGLDIQVANSLRLRMTKSRDVREPNFSERFDAQGGGGAINDPQFDNAEFQITSVAGGNPNLRPEIADTLVAGFVYQPSGAPGLQLSTDWYDVKIKDAVGQLGLQRIVDECELNGVQELCAQITRNPDTGVIGRIFNVYLNVAQARVKGVDTEVVYNAEPNLFGDLDESFSLRALAGYLIERADTPFGGVPFDVAGSLNAPKLTTVITGNYIVGRYSFQLQGRYIDSVKRNARWVEGVDVDDNSVSSSTWFNARVGYTRDTPGGATWRLSLNIQNLFDVHPPIIASFSSRGGSQFVSNVYDTLGRRYDLTLNYNF
jgi:iron complex outermembrane receptor protein